MPGCWQERMTTTGLKPYLKRWLARWIWLFGEMSD
jgi:hypothetical protein